MLNQILARLIAVNVLKQSLISFSFDFKGKLFFISIINNFRLVELRVFWEFL